MHMRVFVNGLEMFRIVHILLCFVVVNDVLTKKFEGKEKPAWAKKDIRDYSDADLERLLEQWEEDDEPLEEDELPEHLRPQPKIDFGQVDMSNPENVLKLTKKGRTLMMFVTVGGKPGKEDTEQLTKLWQTGLWNNHIQAERYLVDNDRAIFMFKDGSQAWDAKDFLVEQERCKEVVIESKSYPGRNYRQEVEEETKKRESKEEL